MQVTILENRVAEFETLRRQILYLRPLTVDLIQSVPALGEAMERAVLQGDNEWLLLNVEDPGKRRHPL